MQEDNVIPSLKSDHSAIVLSINGIENSPRGPSFWRLNSSLLDDKEYVSLINVKYTLWNDESKDVTDSRLFCDLMKYRIRQESISYNKLKVPITPKYFFRLNKSLHLFETQCAFLPLFNPNLDFLQPVQATKSGHHLLHDRAVRGMGLFPV